MITNKIDVKFNENGIEKHIYINTNISFDEFKEMLMEMINKPY